MALSEDFLLNFKFGGDAAFLEKLTKLMNRIDEKFESVEGNIEETSDATRKMADSVDDLNDSFKDGMGSISEFGERLKDVAKYYLSFQAIKAGAEKVWSFGMESMDAYATQERAENQLKGVLRNRGTLNQFDEISKYAADLQTRSIYGDEALIKGAGELATYVKGTDSLKRMMDVLVDYTAGMTGGGEVSPEQMESMATGLGMAYDGNYMAMRRKGFDTSKLEALDAIIESGGVWNDKMKNKYGDVIDNETLKKIRELKGVTEDMRVDALKDALSDWEGLSDAVNSIDSSALVKLKNKISDIQEELGKKLYPTFNRLVTAIDKRMPAIEDVIFSIGEIFESLVGLLEDNIDVIKDTIEAAADLFKLVAKYPKATLAVALGLNTVASGAFKASGSFAEMTSKIKDGTFQMKTLNTACAALAGGSAGYAMMDVESAEQSAGSGLQGALGGVAMGALAGAKAFGIFGAAVGAAAAAVGAAFKSIYAEIKAYQDVNESEEEWQKKEERLNAMLMAQKDVINARKMGQEHGERVSTNRLKKLVEDFERDYGEGSAGTGFKMTIEGGQAAWNKKIARDKAEAEKSAKKARGDIYNTYYQTNIEQHVSVAAELEKIGLLLNQSIRKTIEGQLIRNKAVGIVAGA